MKHSTVLGKLLLHNSTPCPGPVGSTLCFFLDHHTSSICSNQSRSLLKNISQIPLCPILFILYHFTQCVDINIVLIENKVHICTWFTILNQKCSSNANHLSYTAAVVRINFCEHKSDCQIVSQVLEKLQNLEALRDEVSYWKLCHCKYGLIGM